MEANVMLIIQVSVATGVIVELLKNFGLSSNILAVVSTILGAVLASSISGPAIPTIIAGAVIGAGTSGAYDIGVGLKSALENVELFKDINKTESSEEVEADEDIKVGLTIE